MNFEEWFREATASVDEDGKKRARDPFGWQVELAQDQRCGDRLVQIPTGYGKTLGVAATWLFHRVVRGDERWPTRLVWMLPMRTLVEQTRREVDALIAGAGFGPDAATRHVQSHLLMGGTDVGPWHREPERPAVLIGTQDMLLSRALNRGYAAFRARWPTEFGLLSTDCLWVLDEVQLMDVGLATALQLAAFRHALAAVSPRPNRDGARLSVIHVCPPAAAGAPEPRR